MKSKYILAIGMIITFSVFFHQLAFSQLKIDFNKIETFRCRFPKGVATDWDGGEIGQKPTSFKNDLIFTEIDRESKSAYLIGNAGKSKLILILGNNVIHFLEITPTGNMTVMSAFNHPLPNRNYPAVFSRHINLMGAIVSQYYGECKNMN